MGTHLETTYEVARRGWTSSHAQGFAKVTQELWNQTTRRAWGGEHKERDNLD